MILEVNVDANHDIHRGDFVYFCPGVSERIDGAGQHLNQVLANEVLTSDVGRQRLAVEDVSEGVVAMSEGIWVIQPYRSTRRRERERFVHPRLSWTLLEPKAWATLYGSRTA